MPYRTLDPRTELEQTVTADLKAALDKRGAAVQHHGKPGYHAPASAPCDISVEFGPASRRRTLMIEVAQRTEASEFQSIVSHLDAWVANRGAKVDLLYSGRATSARMARLVRNENERRSANKLPGRIVFIKLDDLEAFLARWKGLPAAEAPISSLANVFERHAECVDDLTSAEIFRQEVFPDWSEKAAEIKIEKEDRLATQQERLKKDIRVLENKLREAEFATGQRAHKYLIFLFFMALYEDKRGASTRATRQGFLAYRESMSQADRNAAEFKDRTVHHLLQQNILADPKIMGAGIPAQYDKIDLPDDFVLERVIPVFENYSFADVSIDAIGAVFEALARRAEKDNRIGQFFTPETAVTAVTRLAGLRPTDLVADPACGTGRFLIRAMYSMLAQTSNVPGMSPDTLSKRIREDLLLGCDIDPWIAIIAKMNMYVHGDGKSNIRHGNGLTLASVPTFSPQIPTPIVDQLDVVLTNPPLGDVNFQDVAENVARSQLDSSGRPTPKSAITRAAAAWSKGNFEVIPHTVAEEATKQKAQEAADKWRDKRIAAVAAGNTIAAEKATKHLHDWELKRDAAVAAIASNNVHYVPAGATSKGGSLFLSSLLHSLKKTRDPSFPLEWQGGVVGIIIDESILNTPMYAAARKFIRKQYFIKAIVSLPRDTFAELAKTTAKTSILLLIRKADPDVIQREPVIFARAERTGAVGRDVKRPNDLDPICDGFDAWRAKILAEVDSGSVPAKKTLSAAMSAMRKASDKSRRPIQLDAWDLDHDLPEERLDEAHWRKKALVDSMEGSWTLSQVADLVTKDRTPPDLNVYSFASVVRNEARVRPKGSTDTLYSADKLQEVREGDILVSGIDLVHGAVAVVDADCDGMVVSKEYYILRAKSDYDAHWIAALLRTGAMRRIVEGTITGISNRTRVESPEVLMGLRIPAPPTKGVQREVGDALRAALDHRRSMADGIVDAEQLAAAAAKLPFSGLSATAGDEAAGLE